jgi:hypothetical protein
MTAHQRDLFTKRWRKVAAPEPLEEQIQRSLVEHLRWRARPGIIYFHAANGGWRFKRTAGNLKAMGVRPGVADLIVWWSDVPSVTRVLCLELKRPGGKQSPEQKQFQADCGRVYADYEIADNIDDAIKILERYGVLRGQPQ